MTNIKRILKRNWLFMVIILILITWSVYSYMSHGLIHYLFYSETQEVVDYINSFGAFSQIIFVLIVVLEVVLAPIPPLILYVISGLLYGSLYGGLLVLFGNLIGAMINFILARSLFGKSIDKKINKKLKKKFDDYFNKYGALSIFLLRVNPLTSSDIVSYLAGLTNLKPLKFLIATAFGLAPLVFLQTYFGGKIIGESSFLTWATIFFSVIYMILFLYLIVVSLFKKEDDS